MPEYIPKYRPQYQLEAKGVMHNFFSHHMNSTISQVVDFDAKNDKEALKIAFDPKTLAFETDDENKKLWKFIGLQGARIRIYPDD
jgi:hypothetical protein